VQASLYLNARVGCTHLTVDVLLSPQEIDALKSRGSKELLEDAIARGSRLFPERTFEGPKGKVIAQIGSQASIFGGDLDVTVSLSDVPGSNAAPMFRTVVPFAAVPGRRCSFGMYGSNMNGCQDMVICRRGCALPDLEVVRYGLTERKEEYLEFVLPSPAEGLHFVEVQRGSLLSSNSAPILIVNSVEAVNEIRQLEYDTAGVGDGQGVASFLRTVGVVLDWLRKKDNNDSDAGDIPGYTSYIADTLRPDSESAAIIAPLAQRVVAICILRGWQHLLRLVLPAMVAPGTDPRTVIEGFKSFSNGNLPLLHLAVLSRCPEVVNVLAEWSQSPAVQYTWHCEGAGDAAVHTNPLHLAALLDDGGRMAACITSLFLDNFALWGSQPGGRESGDGRGSAVNSTPSPLASSLSPAEFAVLVNNKAVCSWLQKNGVSLDYTILETLAVMGGGNNDNAVAEGSRQLEKEPTILSILDNSISEDITDQTLLTRLTIKNPDRQLPQNRGSYLDQLFRTVKKESGDQLLCTRQGHSTSRNAAVLQGMFIAVVTGLALYVRDAYSLS
jgi:hypothetical protein